MSQLVSLDTRVGTDVSEVSSFHDLMDQAGFNFNIERVPCHTPEGNVLKNQYIIRREDNKRVLSVVRGRYTPVDSRKMFEPFHNMVEKYGATYETAGVIGGGKKCWISAVLPDEFEVKGREGDVVQRRILALVANDSTSRNAYFSLAHRIVCNNQMRLMNNAANASEYKVSHTKNWEAQHELAQVGFDQAISAHREFEKVIKRLDDQDLSVPEVRGFTVQLFPERPFTPEEIKNKKERRPTSRLNNRREEVVDLFLNGKGNQGRTRWDALNAVTEYMDHHNQIKKLDHKENGYRNAERRFVSNTFGGPGDIVKQKALQLLMNSRNFDKVNPFSNN